MLRSPHRKDNQSICQAKRDETLSSLIHCSKTVGYGADLNEWFVREITLALQMLGVDVSLKAGFQSDQNHKKLIVRD